MSPVREQTAVDVRWPDAHRVDRTTRRRTNTRYRRSIVMTTKTSSARSVRAPRGTKLTCKGWPQEAAYRMIQNNLDPEVAERPEDLVVYGGIGKAARTWDAYDAIIRALTVLEYDETLLVQSGKPVGDFRTHVDAPRHLIANSYLLPPWARTRMSPDRVSDSPCREYGARSSRRTAPEASRHESRSPVSPS